ncbi:MAG TPA: hypothetical protein VLE91_05035 [Candidatus Saccharimonadales bacterium]|nr:hypothetical protein [Candidatus Saccharimonadales bacterium]
MSRIERHQEPVTFRPATTEDAVLITSIDKTNNQIELKAVEVSIEGEARYSPGRLEDGLDRRMYTYLGRHENEAENLNYIVQDGEQAVGYILAYREQKPDEEVVRFVDMSAKPRARSLRVARAMFLKLAEIQLGANLPLEGYVRIRPMYRYLLQNPVKRWISDHGYEVVKLDAPAVLIDESVAIKVRLENKLPYQPSLLAHQIA